MHCQGWFLICRDVDTQCWNLAVQMQIQFKTIFPYIGKLEICYQGDEVRQM